MTLEDRFEIEPPIYIGQVATSYPARQKGLDRKVLLKVIHPQWMNDAELVERFNREAKAMAQIDHPNVVKVFDYGKADDVQFMAMEWIDGGTLKDEVKKGPLAQSRVKSIAYGVLSGLDAVHQLGLIHRDIKPDNILIGVDGSPRLADFSLAGFSRISSFTRHGDMIGTPAYLAPELLDGTSATIRSDLYAVGLVLLESLTGSNPHQADDPVLCLELVRKVDLPRLSDRSSIDEDLAYLIDKLLQKKPGDRPQDAVSALKLLQTDHKGTPYKKTNKNGLFYAVFGAAALIALTLIIKSGDSQLEQRFCTARFIRTPTPMVKQSEAAEPIAGVTHDNTLEAVEGAKNDNVAAASSAETLDRTSDQPLPRTGMLKVIARPWAEVYIDNEPVGLTPLEAIELPSGNHRLRLQHYDLPPFEKDFFTDPDQVDTIAVDMRIEAGLLSVTATPWGYLWVDGDSIGLLPRDKPVWVSPGLHSILIDHPDLNRWEDTITVSRNEEVSIKVDVKNGTMIATRGAEATGERRRSLHLNSEPGHLRQKNE